MIFVTVGHKEFDRLIKKMDEIANEISDEVVAQVGDRPNYLPKKMNYFRYVTRNEVDDYFQKSDLIISHCSNGSIIRAINYSKPLIMVPRFSSLGEHIDDHQVEFAKTLIEQKSIKGIRFVFDISMLKDIIEEVFKNRGNVYCVSEDRKSLINTIYSFISDLKKEQG